MSIQMQQGSAPHIFWINLYNDGMIHECAVMKHDAAGSVYFIKVTDLDPIDRQRLAKIVSHPRSRNFALYDLMSQQTLNNGVNALTYFHQLVKILTPGGKIYNPNLGMLAATPGQVQAPAAAAPAQPQAQAQQSTVTNPAQGNNVVVA